MNDMTLDELKLLNNTLSSVVYFFVIILLTTEFFSMKIKTDIFFAVVPGNYT